MFYNMKGPIPQIKFSLKQVSLNVKCQTIIFHAMNQWITRKNKHTSQDYKIDALYSTFG